MCLLLDVVIFCGLLALVQHWMLWISNSDPWQCWACHWKHAKRIFYFWFVCQKAIFIGGPASCAGYYWLQTFYLILFLIFSGKMGLHWKFLSWENCPVFRGSICWITAVYMHTHSVFFQGLHFGSLYKVSLQHVTFPAKQLMKSLNVSKEGKKREKQTKKRKKRKKIFLHIFLGGCASVPLLLLCYQLGKAVWNQPSVISLEDEWEKG